MPIHRAIPLSDLSPDEFDRIDAVVMRHAYDAHNRLGRLFDERVYENELARTLRAAGHEVHTQVPVTVTLGGFEKIYYLDIIVDHMPYELKTVATLLPEHKAQALHCAMLMDVRRVKLLNFRNERVEGNLCFAPVNDALRRQARFDTGTWRPQSDICESLLRQLRELMADWGTHLSSRLYTEALVHFSGGEARCLQRVPVGDLGTHLLQSHAPGMAFLLTSLTRGLEDYRHHLVRLINHLQITALQWFNLDHSTVACETLFRGMARELERGYTSDPE
ncbi:MAG: GxxExxY protein [Verrucomicrobia bacterium]|nr:GxxExxY protein [Verrucomicrobiota bacterium]